MTTIRVKENEPFDVALRRFKRTIEKLGLLTELRAREFYEKPTAERKRKKAAAVKRPLQARSQHAAAQEALLRVSRSSRARFLRIGALLAVPEFGSRKARAGRRSGLLCISEPH